jgi:multicomponent K+:H+ antiporter subunit E
MNLIRERPILSVCLVLLWLLLTDFTLGNLLLGLAVAAFGVTLVDAVDLPATRVKSWWALTRLAGLYLSDVLASNLAVSLAILRGPDYVAKRSGFIEIDLKIRNPQALTFLSIMLTSAPGTAWVDYDPTTGRLLVHALDLSDPEALRSLVQDRYEPLLEEALG